MSKVTDQSLLKMLNEGSGKVSDPALLSELNSETPSFSLLKPKPWENAVPNYLAQAPTKSRGRGQRMPDLGTLHNPYPVDQVDIANEGDFIKNKDGSTSQKVMSWGEKALAVGKNTLINLKSTTEATPSATNIADATQKLGQIDAYGGYWVGDMFVPNQSGQAEALRASRNKSLVENAQISGKYDFQRQNVPLSIDRANFNQEFEDSQGLWGATKAIVTNPASGGAFLAESLGGSAPAIAMSALTKNPFALVAIQGASGAQQELATGIAGYLDSHGYPRVTWGDLPEEVINAAVQEATARALVVGGVEAFGGKVASKALVPRSIANSPAKAAVLNPIAQSLAGGVIDASGEATAQVLSGQGYDPKEVVAEAGGGLISSPVEALQSTVHAMKLQGKDFIEVASNEELHTIATDAKAPKDMALGAALELMNRGMSIDSQGNLVKGAPKPMPVTPLGVVGQGIERGAVGVGSEPVAPVQTPTQPSEPTQPVAPSTPAEPQSPTTPVNLGGIIDDLFGKPKDGDGKPPSAPDQPTTPVAPTPPDEPVEPTKPAEPVEPKVPEPKPVEPTAPEPDSPKPYVPNIPKTPEPQGVGSASPLSGASTSPVVQVLPKNKYGAIESVSANELVVGKDGSKEIRFTSTMSDGSSAPFSGTNSGMLYGKGSDKTIDEMFEAYGFTADFGKKTISEGTGNVNGYSARVVKEGIRADGTKYFVVESFNTSGTPTQRTFGAKKLPNLENAEKVQPLGTVSSPNFPDPNAEGMQRSGISENATSSKTTSGAKSLTDKLKLWAAYGTIRHTDRTKVNPSKIDVTEIDDSQLPQALLDSKKMLEKFFGVKAVFYKNNGKKFSFTGVTARDIKEVFVDVDGRSPVLNTLYHEFLHQLAKNNPAQYKRLRDYIAKNVKYNAHSKFRGYTNLTTEGRIEEVNADLMGEALTDPAFLREMAKKEPNIFKDLAEKIIAYIDNFLNKVSGNNGFTNVRGNKYLKDVREYRELLSDVLSEVAKDYAAKNTPSQPISSSSAPIMAVADIEKLSDNRGSLKTFAQQFADKIKQKDKTLEDAERIAKDFVDEFVKNPSEFLPKVKGENLSADTFLRMPDGTKYDPSKLEHANATDQTILVHKAVQDGSIKSALNQEAENINKKRAEDLSALASYIHGNADYSLAEQAIILKGAASYGVRVNPDKTVKLVPITDSNTVSIAVITSREASAVAEELRNGKTMKQAMIDGIQDAIAQQEKANKSRGFDGWKTYKQSNKLEDAVALKDGCAGREWCTASATSTAQSQLSQGDFHVFYKDGSPILALRTEDGKLAEPPRGSLSGQFMTEEEEAIAEEALKAGRVTGGEDYLHDRKLISDVMSGKHKQWSDYDLFKNIGAKRKARVGYGRDNDKLPDPVVRAIMEEVLSRRSFPEWEKLGYFTGDAYISKSQDIKFVFGDLTITPNNGESIEVTVGSVTGFIEVDTYKKVIEGENDDGNTSAKVTLTGEARKVFLNGTSSLVGGRIGELQLYEDSAAKVDFVREAHVNDRSSLKARIVDWISAEGDYDNSITLDIKNLTGSADIRNASATIGHSDYHLNISGNSNVKLGTAKNNVEVTGTSFLEADNIEGRLFATRDSKVNVKTVKNLELALNAIAKVDTITAHSNMNGKATLDVRKVVGYASAHGDSKITAYEIGDGAAVSGNAVLKAIIVDGNFFAYNNSKATIESLTGGNVVASIQDMAAVRILYSANNMTVEGKSKLFISESTGKVTASENSFVRIGKVTGGRISSSWSSVAEIFEITPSEGFPPESADIDGKIYVVKDSGVERITYDNGVIYSGGIGEIASNEANNVKQISKEDADRIEFDTKDDRRKIHNELYGIKDEPMFSNEEDSGESYSDISSQAISDAIDRARSEAEGKPYTPASRKSARIGIQRNLELLESGKITNDEFVRRMGNILKGMEDVAADKRVGRAFKERARGADRIKERMLQAKREGSISDKAYDLMEWFVNKNPALFDELGISVKSGERASGTYNPANRIMTLFKNEAKDTTAVHEALHHLERMMPADMQKAIKKEWMGALVKAMKSGDKNISQYAKLIFDSFANPASLKDAMAMLMDGRVPYNMYGLVNASEFWTVSMTDTVDARYKASDSLIGRTVQWLKEALEHIKGALGLKSNAPMLKALNALLKDGDGTIAPKSKMLAEAKAYDSISPNSKLDDAKSFVATIESVRSRAFDSLVSRADALRKDVPQLDAIFKKIFIFAGGKNVGVKNVIESAEQIRTIFHNEVEKAIEGAFGHNKDLNEQENNELRQAILGFPVANQAVQRAGQRISDLMKQTRDRAEAAGIPIGEVTDIGYLPRVYKTHEIQKNKEGFLRDATRLFHDHEFELEVGDANQTYTNKKMLSKYIALMRLYGLTDPTVKSAVNVVKDQMRIIKGTKDQATRIAAFQEIINQMNAVRPIIQQKYAETRANAWFIGMGMRSMRDYVNVVPDPKARPTKDRMLSGAADTVMKDWLDVDVRELMSGYAGVMSRKISASEAFGKDPMKSVDSILNGIRRRGEMTEAQFDEAQALISSAMGWKDRPHDGVVRNTLDAVATLATLGLLEQATFTSLAEPITTTIRTGNLKHLVLPLRQLATALVRSRVKDRDVAYAIGLIARNAASAVSLHRVGVMEADYSRWSSKTLTRFFTLNMLTQLTNDQRLLAMRVGAEEFKRLAKKALRGNVMATDFMKEHGITDIQAFSDWIESINGIPQEADIYGADGAMTPMGQIYADAVHRFVNGSIQNPNATLKPAWASDPKLRLLSGIMSFAYAIYENLIKRELRILKEGTASEGATRMATVFAPTMVALVVSQIAISALRMIMNGDDPEDEEFMEKAIQRGTLNVVSFGVSGQALNFVTGYKYASTASETLIGAYPSYFAKGMDLVMKSFSDRNSDNTETAENAKGKGIYDLVVAPIVLAGATNLPAGYKWFSRLAIAIESHKQTREKFAEMFGIPPERENATDKAYSEKMKGSEKAVEMVTAKVKGTDKAQWDEQFEAMKKEFPELLEGYEFVTYADNSENRKKGRAGEQQTTPSGKVKLQNKNLDEVDDEKKVITSLNKSLKTVRTTSDLTYAGLKDAVTIDEKSYSPVADKMLADIAEEDMDDEIGRANRIKVIKDLEEQRTEVKKKAILDLK